MFIQEAMKRRKKMARITLSDLDKFSSGSSTSFFKLENDGDVARVRILLDKPEDLENYIYSVHQIKVPGSNYPRLVNCIREYEDPIDECPFCAAQKTVVPRIVVPLYNIEADEVQLWTRSKGFMSKLMKFINRYKKPSVVAHIIEIERNGKTGDKQTSYELFDIEADESILEDFPEVPDPLGIAIMDKSAEDMEYYLDEGDFPDKSDDADEKPATRRNNRGSSRKGRNDAEEDEKPRSRATRRRTPAKSDDEEEDF